MIEIKADKYQILKDAYLTVDGLTFLVGSTDQGKSSFIRAVYGAITNQSGSDFIQQGEDTAEVELRFNDDLEVLWEKAKRGSGTYHLNGEKFEKTGKGYFDELLRLGFQPIEAGRNDFHIQFWRQMHPFLLLNRPNTRKFEILSCIFDSKKFQEVMDDMKSDRKEVKNEIEEKEIRVDQLEDQIEGKQKRKNVYKNCLEKIDFELVEKKFNHFKEVKNVRKTYFDCKNVLNSLEGVVEEVDKGIEDIEKELSFCSDNLDTINNLEKYFDLKNSIQKIGGVEDSFQSISDVSDLFEKYRLMKKAYQLHNIIESINQVEDVQLPNIEEEFNQFLEEKEVIQKFFDVQEEKKELDLKVKELEKQKEHIENELEELEKELGYCPVCGSEFS